MPSKPSSLARSAKGDASEKKSSNGWLTKGRDNVQAKKSSGGFGTAFVPEFFLKDKEVALIRIPTKLSNLEISVGRHTYKKKSKRGNEYYQSFTCTGDEDCMGCRNGDKPSNRWPMIIIDKRKDQPIKVMSEDKKSSKIVKKSDVVKRWTPSLNEMEKFLAACEDYKTDKGKDPAISKMLIRVRRVGQGAQTGYTFSFVKTEELSEKEIKNLAKFKEEFGDLESQLKPLSKADQKIMIGDNTKDRDSDEDSEDEEDSDDIKDAEEDEDAELEDGDDEPPF